MIAARNNPHPRTICWSRERLEKQRRVDIDNYKFYARALKVIYNKPKLRNKIIELMKEIEETEYFEVPKCR